MNCSEFEELWQWQRLSSYPDDKRTMGLSEFRSLRRNLIVDSLCWLLALLNQYDRWLLLFHLAEIRIIKQKCVASRAFRFNYKWKCGNTTKILALNVHLFVVLWYDGKCVHFLAILLLFWNAATETQYTAIYIMAFSWIRVFAFVFIFSIWFAYILRCNAITSII